MKDPVVTRRSYRVEITVEEMVAILDRDARCFQSLFECLQSLDGVINVEYDGHFGPNVFYDVNDEDDGPNHKRVMAVIKQRCKPLHTSKKSATSASE